MFERFLLQSFRETTCYLALMSAAGFSSIAVCVVFFAQPPIPIIEDWRVLSDKLKNHTQGRIGTLTEL